MSQQALGVCDEGGVTSVCCYLCLSFLSNTCCSQTECLKIKLHLLALEESYANDFSYQSLLSAVQEMTMYVEVGCPAPTFGLELMYQCIHQCYLLLVKTNERVQHPCLLYSVPLELTIFASTTFVS